MNKIRTAVVGVGHLGQYHAEKYASLPQSELVAVCDLDPDRSHRIAKQYNTKPLLHYSDLIGQVDAVSIAVPTRWHFEVALFFIQNKIHVLIEKPITVTIEEANTLLSAAKERGVLIQVGHIERFNSAIRALDQYPLFPRFIESSRLAPFNPRGTDVNVILDLMIHDIDLIQSWVRAEINTISASGAPVVTPTIDLANARIEFKNGCVANLTASRVSAKKQRSLQLFQRDACFALNLSQKKLRLYRKGEKERFPGTPDITRETFCFEKGDALRDQIEAFLHAILNKQPPLVSGEDGKRALEIAIKMTEIIEERNRRYPLGDPGPLTTSSPRNTRNK